MVSTITISLGSEDGVTLDAPVISEGACWQGYQG